MRNLQFLLVGGLLLAASLLLGRLFQAEFGRALDVARLLFLAAWAALTLFNLWVGVAHAGYTWSEELPIFLVLFGAPVLALWALEQTPLLK